MAEQKCTRDEKKSKTFVKVLLYTRLIDSLTEDGIKLAKKNIISWQHSFCTQPHLKSSCRYNYNYINCLFAWVRCEYRGKPIALNKRVRLSKATITVTKMGWTETCVSSAYKRMNTRGEILTIQQSWDICPRASMPLRPHSSEDSVLVHNSLIHQCTRTVLQRNKYLCLFQTEDTENCFVQDYVNSSSLESW